MQDKDIRRLFQKAEIQVCPEQKRILKMKIKSREKEQ